MSMTNFICYACAFFLHFALVSVCQASKKPDPEIVVKEATQSILQELEKNQDRYKNNQTLLESFLRKKAMPHLDVERMIKLSVGKAWKVATQAEREALINAFYNTMLRYFVTAFSRYSGQAIVFKGKQGFKGQKGGWVKSAISSAMLPDIPVDYRIRSSKKHHGAWKIIDVRVAGISLLKHKRSEFVRIIDRDGINGLVSRLIEKNKKVLTTEYTRAG